jgi:AraC family transcriptional regulator, regulatory protein of adaptative response / methylated-DNA-[protein]-cysteine methyltransferase
MTKMRIDRNVGFEIENDPRWAAVVARDRNADGQFYYSVKSTGVYCRPCCAARLANPKNVAFHPTIADAEGAGFRACKRCKPDQPPMAQRATARIAAACRMIERSEEPPTLAMLAAQADLSPHHFHRVFKSITGLTPKGFADAHRTKRVRDQLADGSSVTEAIYGAGFNSSSRFYEKAGAMLGMAPSAFREGGANATIRFAVGECLLGSVLVAASDKGVCAILLGDEPETLLHDLQDRFPRAELLGGSADFEAIVAAVIGVVEAPNIGLDLPLDVRGTAFQQRVWTALRAIPAGTTASYAEVALAIGAPRSVRAVAHACSANALAVAIPCHRVVRTDGSLSGYRWGIERKRQLLAMEVA